jgi:ABC-type lipoprotein release transport system permease subunit
LVLTGAAVVFLVVILTALMRPALKAASVDPVETLRID